jgi:hypothetical protein
MAAMASEVGGPKKVVAEVSSAIGGVLSASDACSLPRNEQQVTDIRRRQKKGTSSSNTTDELAVVMQKAYLEDGDKCFIREMKTLREPAIIVALDRQLDELVRFCTEEKFGILTVDPTFSLGDFDVTITAYRQLILRCRRSSEHPVFIGPVMVHYKKSFSTYLFFASTLVGIRPELSKLKCFGTDGEQALFEAFQTAFPEAIHLLCSLHMKRNIKAKLRELGVSESVQQIVISDIFGQQIGSQHLEGLIDSESNDEFGKGYDIISQKWKGLDSTEGGSMHVFVSWFHRHKYSVIKETMLKSVRRSAGLGDPPTLFTTNASESVNSLVKNRMDYKKHELPEFLDKLKSVIDDQEKEMEKAIIGRGKYELCEQFKRLEKAEDEWFMRMTPAQRQAHLKRLSSLTVVSKVKAPRLSSLSKSVDQSDKPCCSRQLFQPSPSQQNKVQERRNLSVSVGEFSEFVIIPAAVLDAIWSKASDILSDSKAMCTVPGGQPKDRIVKSSSSVTPHVVSAKKSGQYSCDDKCPNWKSLRVCSHSVAAAEDNGELQLFVKWLKKVKKSPNLTQLALATMPKGRGRKGCNPPPRKKKKVTVKSRKSFAEILKEQCSIGRLNRDNPQSEDSGDSDTEESPLPVQQDLPYQRTSGGAAVNLDPKGLQVVSGEVVTSSPVEEQYKMYECSVSMQGGGVEFSHSKRGTKLNVSGGRQESSSTAGLPLLPPPLVHYPLSQDSESPFELAFISGNISVCRGCRQKYTKPVTPPLDLCIRHKEWQEFLGPLGTPQTRYGNVYYHCNIPCIRSRNPEFEPAMLCVHPIIAMQLMPVHTEYLASQMPGKF